MAAKAGKPVWCAIYTRKSTEHGLELEFNSLDAQREACEAYIKSQASEGWQALPQLYDDPAYSGGNMERPALKQLLKDIDARRVDVVVVYKIDRLTRSLADFAKLVEIFDAKAISFVAVTQQFNTTTSMGRLTLNVLLSFAQFERELSSERVRDKVAASRKKGKWMGGSVPLGYDRKDKKLVVNEREAKTVRMIFERYLALRSFSKLVEELNDKRVVSKTRLVKGKLIGGSPFTYGPLAYLLKNRTYLGESGHKGTWFNGEHEPIVDRKLFEQVQLLLKGNSAGRTGPRRKTSALLTGLIFDDRGNRMSPSFTVKKGVRYRSYVSAARLKGRKALAGSVGCIPATKIEETILSALRQSDPNVSDPLDLIERHVERITVARNKIILQRKQAIDGSTITELPMPASRQVASTENRGAGAAAPDNTYLLSAVVRAHAWNRALLNGEFESIEDLARSVDLHPKVVRKRLCLAYLAPDILARILGPRPSSLLTSHLLKKPMPMSWQQQRQLFA